MQSKHVFGAGDLKQIKLLSLATGYGNIYGVLRLVDADPCRFTPDEIFENVIDSSILLLGLSREKSEALKEKLKLYVKKVPEEILAEPLWKTESTAAGQPE